MFKDKSQFASAFTALVTPRDELIVLESPRATRELELPGGGVDDTDLSVRAAADREVMEESGVYTGGSFAYGQAELSSRLNPSKTGLIVVTLSRNDMEAVDFTFSSIESRRLLPIPIDQFIALPTREEEPDAPMLTFRAHRVMATVALGILNGELPHEVTDYLSAPFNSDFISAHQSHFYEIPVNT